MQSNTIKAELSTAKDGELKKFKILSSSLRYFTMDVLAKNENDAWCIAYRNQENWIEKSGERDFSVLKIREIK